MKTASNIGRRDVVRSDRYRIANANLESHARFDLVDAETNRTARTYRSLTRAGIGGQMLVVQELEVAAGPRALAVSALGAEVAVVCRWLADETWHPVYGLRLGAGRRLSGNGRARTVFCTLAELPPCLDETLVLQACRDFDTDRRAAESPPDDPVMGYSPGADVESERPSSVAL